MMPVICPVFIVGVSELFEVQSIMLHFKISSLDGVTFCGVTLHYVNYFEVGDSKFLPSSVTALIYSTFRADDGLVSRLKRTDLNLLYLRRTTLNIYT